jgi:hypothetical protein
MCDRLSPLDVKLYQSTAGNIHVAFAPASFVARLNISMIDMSACHHIESLTATLLALLFSKHHVPHSMSESQPISRTASG